jgi:peptidoglycan/xylan/chitin deacetylase (PgdA/CDA1 family)
MRASRDLPRWLSNASLLGLLVLPACSSSEPEPAAAAPSQTSQEAWTWPEERILSTATQVRAGRSLMPERWPNNARVAVMLSFDADNELLTIRTGSPTVGAITQGEYGGRVGLQRILALLDRHQIPASFFIPSMSLKITPSMVDQIKASGRHEFGVHGWVHETNSTMGLEDERRLTQLALDEVTRLTGTRPVGYRAPSWDFSPNTLNIIRDLGFLYDSSLMSDDRPYELLAAGQPTGIVELPVEWIQDDAPLFDPRGTRYESPRDILQVWKDEFDVAYEEGTMFLLTTHPHVIGHRSRMVILEELVDYMRSKPGVWFATHGQVAEYVRQQAGLATPTAAGGN